MIPLAKLEAAVSQTVGTPIAISCEADATFPATLDGYALRGADGSVLHIAHVRQSLCTNAQNVDRKQTRLYTSYLMFEDRRFDEVAGPALEVILHEAMHVALQSGDESVVECAAYQNRWALVRQFRLTAWIANAVMQGMAWRHAQFPDAYRSIGAC